MICGRLFAAEYLRNICRLVCGGIVDFFENSIIIKLCVFKAEPDSSRISVRFRQKKAPLL